jgi:hypothetical protein
MDVMIDLNGFFENPTAQILELLQKELVKLVTVTGKVYTGYLRSFDTDDDLKEYYVIDFLPKPTWWIPDYFRASEIAKIAKGFFVTLAIRHSPFDEVKSVI